MGAEIERIFMQISPTPWRVSESQKGYVYISAADGFVIAEIGFPDSEFGRANARYLVAAVNAAAGIAIEQLEDPDS